MPSPQGQANGHAGESEVAPPPPRPLGQTRIRISPLGLGCWQFSQGQGVVGRFWDPIDQATINGIVRAALDGGLNWFDTAELYGRGASETALSTALQTAGRAPEGTVVATKWSPFLRRASHIRRSVAARARNLAPHPIALHQVHQRMPFSSIERQMHAMADLVEDGTIGSVGVSNFGARDMRRAHAVLAQRAIPLASNQVRYNLLDRRIERNGVLEAAGDLGITIISYSPLAQGLLSGRFHDDPEVIRRTGGARRRIRAFRPTGLARSRPVILELTSIGERHGRTPAQVALNWLVFSRGEGVVAIPGATRAEQARQNAGALRFHLTDDEIARLDEASVGFLKG